MYFPVVSQADIELAKYYKNHACCVLVRQRMNVIYLRAKHIGPGQCAELAGVCANSVTRWTKQYIEHGLSSLLVVKRYRPQSNLMSYRDQIKQSFEEDPPRSLGQARKRISQLTGLQRGLTQVRHFVKEILKFKYRKYRRLPGGKKSIEELAQEQAVFLRDTLYPLLNKARRAVAEVFFVDGVHPVQGFHGGYCWSESPVHVRSSSGRQRVNILGALHATRPELYSITTLDYIRAQTVMELIEFLREENPGRQIYMVLDNARYQRCHSVRKVAKKYRVHLVFLPAYSPNLNLIERLWKLLKKEVLAGKFYPTKNDFSEAVDQFIDQVNQGRYDDEIRKLITLNFQQYAA